MILLVFFFLLFIFPVVQLQSTNGIGKNVTLSTVECMDTLDCPDNLVCIPSASAPDSEGSGSGSGNGICTSCSTDDQCLAYSTESACDVEDGICQHKALLPVSSLDVAAALLILVGGAVAAGGGLGGGGLFVPLLVMVAGFTTKEAIPMSNSAIAGVAICNVFLLSRKRHPVLNRPLIDFRMAAVMQPPMLLGTLVGVLVNTVSPSWLILILLIVVLGFTGSRTCLRAYRQTKREQSLASAAATTKNKAGAGAKLDASAAAAGGKEESGSPNHGRRLSTTLDLILEDVKADEESIMAEGMLNASSPLTPGGSLRSLEEEEETGQRTSGKRGRGSRNSAQQSRRASGSSGSPSGQRRRRSRSRKRDCVQAAASAGSRGKARSGNGSRMAAPTLTVSGAAAVPKSPAEDAERAAIEKDEAGVPWILVGLQVFVLVALTVFSILKGSSRGPSVIGVAPCSEPFWLLYWAPAPIVLVVSIYVVRKLVSRDSEKRRLSMYDNAPADVGEVQWTRKMAVGLALASTIAGSMASLLGIGGGMVLGPVMLELGVRPDVASATSSLMVLFTALASISQFLVLGRLDFSYGILFLCVGLVSSAVGLSLVLRIVKRSGKTSIVAWLIGTVLILSTLLLGVIGLLRVIDEINNGSHLGFNPVCK